MQQEMGKEDTEKLRNPNIVHGVCKERMIL
jgi:hypothetical protein